MGGELALIVLAFIWMIFASIEDLKKKEVENWVSFSLVIFALGIRFFYSLFVDSNFMFFYQGLIGFGIFFIVGNVFYYSRIFAGADAKLMIALGAILPFSTDLFVNLKTFMMFILFFFLVGSIYGVSWSIFLSIKNWRKFKKDFSKRFKTKLKLLIGVFALGVVVMSLGFIFELFFLLGIFIFLFPYLFLFAKSVDSVCMVKEVASRDLTEGDWLVKNVKVGKTLIKANWDGLTLNEIKMLRKARKKVLIRFGIPFIPVFLLAFVLLLVYT